MLVTAALATSLMAVGAGAATSECSQSRGLVTAAGAPGEANAMALGYRSKMNTLRLVSRVETSEGAGDVGDLVCPNEDGEWELVKMRLGDKGDIAKLNARDPLLEDDYRQLPATVIAKIRGGLGNDKLAGHEGVDGLHGGGDSDLLRGRAGDDLLTGGNGRDQIRGGNGRDELRAADGNRDEVSCGEGEDLVYADPRDVLRDCERVR